MIRRDFLLVKIREFAAVLAKIIGFRQSAEYVVSMASIDQTLEQWFGVEAAMLTDMKPDTLKKYLADKHHHAEVFDLVGTLLHERGLCFLQLDQLAEAYKMFELADCLLRAADVSVGTFNEDRNRRLRELGLALTDVQNN